VAYELALYVAAFWLSSSSSAFSWPIFGYILRADGPHTASHEANPTSARVPSLLD
jgi:hypothetical protein